MMDIDEVIRARELANKLLRDAGFPEGPVSICPSLEKEYAAKALRKEGINKAGLIERLKRAKSEAQHLMVERPVLVACLLRFNQLETAILGRESGITTDDLAEVGVQAQTEHLQKLITKLRRMGEDIDTYKIKGPAGECITTYRYADRDYLKALRVLRAITW